MRATNRKNNNKSTSQTNVRKRIESKSKHVKTKLQRKKKKKKEILSQCYVYTCIRNCVGLTCAYFDWKPCLYLLIYVEVRL